jgi:hypothetical protein
MSEAAAHVRVIEETPAYWRVDFDYPLAQPFAHGDPRRITGKPETDSTSIVGSEEPQLICPRIALASAAGSAASVIGRPTTMWLAPAAMASAGVATRA